MKTCLKCGSDGPFGKSNRTKDGLKTWCKGCLNAANRKIIAKDAEKERARCRERNRRLRKENIDRWRERERQQYHRDPERHRAQSRNQYRKNIDRSRQLSAERNKKRRSEKAEHMRRVESEYFKRNPEKKYFKNLKSRLIRQKSRGKCGRVQLRARMAFFGNCCAYCGGPYEQVDHAIPLARGGTNWPANHRPACTLCNRKKSATISEKWKNKVASR